MLKREPSGFSIIATCEYNENMTLEVQTTVEGECRNVEDLIKAYLSIGSSMHKLLQKLETEKGGG